MYWTPPSSFEPSPNPQDNANIAPDRRASRSLQSLTPEHGFIPVQTRKIMTKPAATMTVPLSSVLMQQPTEPLTCRSSIEDPKGWLETYKRTATFNNWNCENKLWHVFFSLDVVWELGIQFNNFGPVSQWLPANLQKCSAQGASQNSLWKPQSNYQIKKMTHLFHHTNPDMSKEKKVCSLMHGEKQELLAGLMRNLPKTAAEFLKEAS